LGRNRKYLSLGVRLQSTESTHLILFSFLLAYIHFTEEFIVTILNSLTLVRLPPPSPSTPHNPLPTPLKAIAGFIVLFRIYIYICIYICICMYICIYTKPINHILSPSSPLFTCPPHTLYLFYTSVFHF
jgi:hypothetical protein